MRLRQLRMIATDERVQVVSEVLSGIRVTKLNGWEPLWIQRLHDVRRSEVKLTASELWVFGWSMMASNGVIPVIPPCRLELTRYFLCVSYFTGYGHEPRFGPHGDDKLADAF
jgi:hypothetical protein